MDRPNILDATPQSVQQYVAHLEQRVRDLEQSIQTAADVRDNWERAYHELEKSTRSLQAEKEKSVIQARGLALALERTEKNLREAHMKEGVLAALLESERQRQKREQEAKVPHPLERAGPRGEP